MFTSSSIQGFSNRLFNNVLQYYGVQGELYHWKGYNDLTQLYKINQVLSPNLLWGEIVDRMGQTSYPFQIHVRLPWQVDLTTIDLETACEQEVQQIVTENPGPYNIFWSGGIDSTLVLVSFMKQVPLSSLRVYCNSSSIAENTWLYEKYLKPNLKIFDSLTLTPESGVIITGDCGDTIWACLDEDFIFGSKISQYIYRPWQEWFRYCDSDENLLAFAEDIMARAGRPIDNLLEARWWFYMLYKSQSRAVSKAFLNPKVKIVNFYESTRLESWIWHNLDKIIKGSDWQSYKWPAKEIIYKFDRNNDYLNTKTKERSIDINHRGRHGRLRRVNSLFQTDLNEMPIICTEPFWSDKVYEQQFGSQYDHLFVPTIKI